MYCFGTSRDNHWTMHYVAFLNCEIIIISCSCQNIYLQDDFFQPQAYYIFKEDGAQASRLTHSIAHKTKDILSSMKKRT